MNNLITVSNVRGFIDDKGTAQLNLEDVSRGLGFVQTKKGVEYIRWETITRYLSTFGFSQHVGKDTFIPENVFYRLAMKANNDVGNSFQALIADEILPAIRKTGSYAPKELSRLEILELALAAEKQVLALQAVIEEQKPAVEFAEAVHVSDSVRSIGELAKIICQQGIPMGQNRLFAIMRESGYLGKRESVDYNMPTQKAMNLELFMIKQTPVNRTAGIKIESTPRVTGKGMVYFVNKFVKAKQIADAIALEELGQRQLAEMQASEVH